MTKVVYNGDYGGFGLSILAMERLIELGAPGAAEGLALHREVFSEGQDYGVSFDTLPRHNPLLVQVVEELGAAASGRLAALRVKEITSDRYRIDEYDGSESIETPENIDWVVVE